MEKQARTLPTGTLVKRFLPYFAKHKSHMMNVLIITETAMTQYVPGDSGYSPARTNSEAERFSISNRISYVV